MATRSLSKNRAMTEQDMLQASKAIHDKMEKSLTSKVKEMEDGIALRLGKVLEGEVTALEKRLSAAVASFLEKGGFDAKSLREECLSALEVLRGELRTEVGVIRSLAEAMSSLPAPQVSVNVPPARLVKKKIEYDPHGRPIHIEEQEA